MWSRPYNEAYIPPTQPSNAIRSLFVDFFVLDIVDITSLSLLIFPFRCSGSKSEGCRCKGADCFVRAIVRAVYPLVLFQKGRNMMFVHELE